MAAARPAPLSMFDVTDEEVQKIAVKFQLCVACEDFLSEHVVDRKRYPQTFSADEFGTWLLNGEFCQNRGEAGILGQRMLASGVFHCVTNNSLENFDPTARRNLYSMGTNSSSQTSRWTSWSSTLTPKRNPVDPEAFDSFGMDQDISFTSLPSVGSPHTEWKNSMSAEQQAELNMVNEKFRLVLQELFRKTRIGRRSSSVTAKEIANFLVAKGFCDTREQAGNLALQLVFSGVLRPAGKKEPRFSFDPTSVKYLYTLGNVTHSARDSFSDSASEPSLQDLGLRDSDLSDGTAPESMIKVKSRRPEFLPAPMTNDEEQSRLQDVKSTTFANMADQFQANTHTIFVCKGQGPAWKRKVKTCSAEGIEAWLIRQGFCESKAQAAKVGEKLLRTDYIRPIGKTQEYRPASRIDFYVAGPGGYDTSEEDDSLASLGSEGSEDSSKLRINFKPREAAESLLKTTATIASYVQEKRAVAENTRQNRSNTSVEAHLKAMRELGLAGPKAKRTELPPFVPARVEFSEVALRLAFNLDTGSLEDVCGITLDGEHSKKLNDDEKITRDLLWNAKEGEI